MFTAAQAQAVGMTRHQVHRLVRCGELVALRRGVYVERSRYDAAAASDRSRVDAVAACLTRLGSVISHHSAAVIHSLPMIGARPAIPALTYPAAAGRHADSDRATLIRSAALPPWQVQQRGDWQVTTVARTCCDVARQTPTISALALVDAALSRRLTTLDELCRVLESCAGWRGEPRLRSTLRLAHPGAESPFESVARYQLSCSGVLAVPQVWAYGRSGALGCGDLWLPESWVFLEVDGDVKYAQSEPSDTLLDEKRRQEHLEEAGFGVARVSPRQARDRQTVVRKVLAAAARGQVVRATQWCDGYVGPPPPWARRGTVIDVQRPPESPARPLRQV